MNKIVQLIIILLGSLFLTLLGFNILGFFKLYNCPTTGNEPNLKLNSVFFVSNLKKPSKGDFVCYKYNDPRLGEHIRVHRLVAIEGDIVELKNGILFINAQNIDKKNDLNHLYRVSNKEFDELKENQLFDIKVNEMVTYFLNDNDTENVNITLSDRTAVKLKLDKRRVVDSIGVKSEYIFKKYNKHWNKDNFGPFKIKKGHFFVLGDNRDNSEDSRFIGTIENKKIKGVVVMKL